mgnify:CR=1 FL=1
MRLLIEHKRKLFKVLLALTALYSLQWTRGWFGDLLNYQVFSDVQLISVVGVLLIVMLYWYHKNEI